MTKAEEILGRCLGGKKKIKLDKWGKNYYEHNNNEFVNVKKSLQGDRLETMNELEGLKHETKSKLLLTKINKRIQKEKKKSE